MTFLRIAGAAVFTVLSMSLAASPASAQQGAAGAWVRCAAEHQVCRVPYPTQVRYGVGSRWVERVANGTIGCDNKTFGDPNYGVVKACDYFSPKAAAPKPAAVRSNCPVPGSLRSANSSTAVKITVANSSNRPLKIYWLDYQGGMKFYRDLTPGQSYVQATYVSHPWIAVDGSGRCAGGAFLPGQHGTTWEIFGS